MDKDTANKSYLVYNKQKVQAMCMNLEGTFGNHNANNVLRELIDHLSQENSI